MNDDRTDTSIIIVTYNQAHLLKRALEALANKTVQDFEVIIIDGGSTDTTGLVCSEASLFLQNLSYHFLGQRSVKDLGSCKNLGIKAAYGEFLLFTDSDCIPDRKWVEKMKVALEENPVIAGAVQSPTSEYLLLCHNIAQFHRFFPENKAGPVTYIAGANMGIRKSVLGKTGIFEEGRNMAEDMEWVLRAGERGYKPYFRPDIIITHIPDHRSRFWPILRYAALHAESTIQIRNNFSGQLHTPVVLKSAPLLFLFSPAIAFFTTIKNFFDNPELLRYIHTLPVFFLIRLSWCKGAIRGLQKNKGQ
jgi:GT2 family glycosyltransferase